MGALCSVSLILGVLPTLLNKLNDTISPKGAKTGFKEVISCLLTSGSGMVDEALSPQTGAILRQHIIEKFCFHWKMSFPLSV